MPAAGPACDLMSEAGWRPLGRPREHAPGGRWSAAARLQHSVAMWLVWLVLPIFNLPEKERLKEKKSDFYMLVTNSELFKILRWPNKTCLLVVSRLRFKSIKDQPKHSSQCWIFASPYSGCKLPSVTPPSLVFSRCISLPFPQNSLDLYQPLSLTPLVSYGHPLLQASHLWLKKSYAFNRIN